MKGIAPFVLATALAAGSNFVSASSNHPVGNSRLVLNEKLVTSTVPLIEHSPKQRPTCSLTEVSIASSRGGQSVVGSLQLTTKNAVLSGMVLAFNSGYVNGACLSGVLHSTNMKQVSAAVTGAWTNSALGFASGDLVQFFFNAKCILSYITGSTIAGFLNPNPVPFSISRWNVSPSFLVGAALLYWSSRIAGKARPFDNSSFIYLATVANGIQNSITSTTTCNLVRSTHFTGITSDMGTFLGQLLRGNSQNLMKLKVFAALVASFWVGGAVSYVATKELASSSLMFSAGLYALIGIGIGFSWF
uniref:GDT1 family protein n=1 Tax=Odontella aurita TaxID=265563 RepID=A0A7S4MVR7_9STRA|mmetsp:Transcript_35762/g.106734  ORF Transcript_35762/g.106734 Transcript_35762/m.106734 type:complete len:303 (+) Transcript_35762:307-1215(+)